MAWKPRAQFQGAVFAGGSDGREAEASTMSPAYACLSIIICQYVQLVTAELSFTSGSDVEIYWGIDRTLAANAAV
jgi:hypothetical protein